MSKHKHQLILISISIFYWIKLSNGWKLDNRNILHTNQNILFACPLNTMCQCAGLPNETSLLEINCNEVSLYKFPGKFSVFFLFLRNVRIFGYIIMLVGQS